MVRPREEREGRSQRRCRLGAQMRNAGHLCNYRSALREGRLSPARRKGMKQNPTPAVPFLEERGAVI